MFIYIEMESVNGFTHYIWEDIVEYHMTPGTIEAIDECHITIKAIKSVDNPELCIYIWQGCNIVHSWATEGPFPPTKRLKLPRF